MFLKLVQSARMTCIKRLWKAREISSYTFKELFLYANGLPGFWSSTLVQILFTSYAYKTLYSVSHQLFFSHRIIKPVIKFLQSKITPICILLRVQPTLGAGDSSSAHNFLQHFTLPTTDLILTSLAALSIKPISPPWTWKADAVLPLYNNLTEIWRLLPHSLISSPLFFPLNQIFFTTQDFQIINHCHGSLLNYLSQVYFCHKAQSPPPAVS